MSQDNQITLRGFVTAEPTFRQTTQTQTALTEIRVGSTPRWLNRDTGEWQDGQTCYFTVKCWRRLAMNAKASLHKGDTVIVRGKFYLTTWVDKETQRPRSAVEIEADSIGHDLTYGHTIFSRGGQPHPGSAGAVNAGELARQGGGEGPGGVEVYDDGAAAPQPVDADWSGDGPQAPDGALADLAVSSVTSGYGAEDALATPF